MDSRPLPAPSDHDVASIARAVCRKVQRLVAHGKEDDEHASLLDKGHPAHHRAGPRPDWPGNEEPERMTRKYVLMPRA